MEFRKLRYFVVAADEENFHRAAGRLHIAQPALTRHIKELEAELGVSLFERAKKRVKLSTEGHLFLRHARRILNDMDQAVAHMRRVAEGTTGSLRVSFIPPAWSNSIVPESFREFRRLFANVDLNPHLITSRLAIDALCAGQLDAAYVHRSAVTVSEDLERLVLARDHWVIVLPFDHPMANRDNLQLADFRGENLVWIPREQAPETYDELIPPCLAAGLNLKIFHAAGDFRFYLSWVEAGFGVTITAASIAEGYQSPRVVFRKISDFGNPFYIDLVWLRENSSSLLAKYVGMVKNIQGKAVGGDAVQIGTSAS